MDQYETLNGHHNCHYDYVAYNEAAYLTEYQPSTLDHYPYGFPPFTTIADVHPVEPSYNAVEYLTEYNLHYPDAFSPFATIPAIADDGLATASKVLGRERQETGGIEMIHECQSVQIEPPEPALTPFSAYAPSPAVAYHLEPAPAHMVMPPQQPYAYAGQHPTQCQSAPTMDSAYQQPGVPQPEPTMDNPLFQEEGPSPHSYASDSHEPYASYSASLTPPARSKSKAAARPCTASSARSCGSQGPAAPSYVPTEVTHPMPPPLPKSTKDPHRYLSILSKETRARWSLSPRVTPPSKRLLEKKPLQACLFCRERKIACGLPPPGSDEQTCNQCFRRQLKCEAPPKSRRGQRKKRR